MATNGNRQQLSDRNYIRWDAKGVEVVPPNEKEDIQAVVEQINEMQRRVFNKSRHCFGGTHARTQGIVVGKFVVPSDLPEHLKQSEIFEKGGEYPVACRYSSEPGDPGLDDRIPQPRGFAMKLFDVHGEMYEAGAGYPTQDIEFNSTPAIELADARTTKEILALRLRHGHDKAELYQHLERRPDAALQKARDQVRNTHLESTRWYSQTAYRFGDYVVKYSLTPATATQRELARHTVEAPDGDDVLHRWLSDFHRGHDAEFSFQVQLLEDLDDQPVEYAGTAWDEARYPWQEVARLLVPRQESWDFARKSFWEDHLRIDPWHGLVKLQPLGSTNRLRRALYPASSELRRKMNGRNEIHVTSIDEMPA